MAHIPRSVYANRLMRLGFERLEMSGEQPVIVGSSTTQLTEMEALAVHSASLIMELIRLRANITTPMFLMFNGEAYGTVAMDEKGAVWIANEIVDLRLQRPMRSFEDAAGLISGDILDHEK